MFGLVTMLLSTLGATGMGSILKILGGLVQSISDGNEAKAKREMARDLAMSSADIKFQQAVFEVLQIPKQTYLLGLLGGLLLLSGCSTLRPSQSSALSTQESSSSPLHHPKIKKPLESYGGSLQSQAEEKSPRQSRQGIFLWSQSPLWEQ